MLNNIYVCINKDNFSYYNELMQDLIIKKYKEKNIHLMNIIMWKQHCKKQNLFQLLIDRITLRYINNPLYKSFYNSQIWLEQFNDNYYTSLEKIFTHNCSNVYISLDLYYKLKKMEDKNGTY